MLNYSNEHNHDIFPLKEKRQTYLPSDNICGNCMYSKLTVLNVKAVTKVLCIESVNWNKFIIKQTSLLYICKG